MINAVEAMKYSNDIYPNIANTNEKNQGYSTKLKDQEGAKFFVIKSFTEEDIHKVNINYIK